MNVLYSTGCPRCSMLKKKLSDMGVDYVENNNIDEMLSLGINDVPVLSVNGRLMNFSEAIKWLVSGEGEVRHEE